MIIIQTVKHELATGKPFYKDYHATSGLKAEMSIIEQDRNNNDLSKYDCIKIINVWDTDED